MRGLRSRILRTLQSFPNAAAQSSLLLPNPNAAPSPPQEHAPSPEEAEAQQQEKAASELPTVADCGGGGDEDKENVSPEVTTRKAKKMKASSENHRESGSPGGDGPCYRRPDPGSASLFDPDLLAAFRGAVDAYARALEEAKRRDDGDTAVPDGGVEDHLAGFESRCPPGGERAVVMYTTSLRGVRKTFEDCARVRRLLEGLRVAFLERDVSMHAPYRDELRGLLPPGASLPPRLFVDGKYIGGADEVVALHEQARLRPVLRRAARRAAGELPCAACGGARFVVCGGCSGSHRLYDGGATGGRVPCPGCNENGLVPCPLCS